MAARLGYGSENWNVVESGLEQRFGIANNPIRSEGAYDDHVHERKMVRPNEIQIINLLIGKKFDPRTLNRLIPMKLCKPMIETKNNRAQNYLRN